MSDFAAYVFYVNRPDLLARSINAFPDLQSNLTIVDNSGSGMAGYLANEDFDWPKTPIEVFVPPVPLSYSQSLNWMLKDAESKGVDFIVHFHSDASSTNPDAVSQLLDYARKVKEEGKKWACLWTLYDILWVINPVAAREVGGWDTVFPSYFVDNDIRRRWNLAGWETIDTHIEGMSHVGSATINSDPELKFLNSVTFPLYGYYYQRKHGGEPGHEKFLTPFNR